MAIQVTADGRLTDQPQVRYSQAGKPWATGTIVSNERRLNKQTQEWEDANTTFLRFKMFGAQSEALANLSKGELVIATGKLVQNDYEDKDGNRRQSMELIVSTIGAVVRNTPATPPAGGSGATGWHNPSPAPPQAVHGAPSGPFAADMPASTPYSDGTTPF